MKKVLSLIIVIISMLAINVYAEPTTWPKTFTNGDYEYKIEGVSLKVYQQRIDSHNEEQGNVLNEEDQNNYLNETPIRVIDLNPADFTINPEYKEDKLNNEATKFIDLNLNITKQKLEELLQTELTNTTSDKHYQAELEVKYRLTRYPTKYQKLYSYNFIRAFYNTISQMFSANQSTDTIYKEVNPSESISQVINLVMTNYNSTTSKGELLYETAVTTENGMGSAILNYLVLSEAPITSPESLPTNSELLMFHNIDNIDYLIENLKEIEETEEDLLENPKTDIVEEVAVPNTAQRVQIYLFILGFTFVLIGFVPMIYILYNNQKKKQEV